jgi:hypothetical protein
MSSVLRLDFTRTGAIIIEMRFETGQLFFFALTSIFAICLTGIFFYNIGLNLLTAQALAGHNIEREEANSLLYMTAHENKEYKVYLQEVKDPENFQYFDEWKEHKVFTWTLSDLQESN